MISSKKHLTSGSVDKAFINEGAVIRKLSFISIAGNIVLSGFKLFAGIAGHSGAMVSDAVHSFSDVIATFIAFFGVIISKKPADKSHPYGHERLECAAALLLGFILLITGIGVGKAGIEKIFLKDSETLAVPGMIALAAAVISIIVKEAMYRYTKYYAVLINSTAFMADAWHHRSDAFSSIGSFIGITGAMLGFPVLDALAGVVICFFILKAAGDIVYDALRNMLDTACDADYEKSLAEYISRQKGVMRVDLLRSRMFGSRVYIDLEIAVDGDKSLRDAHMVAERVHAGVEKNFPNIKHIMIHVNPAK